MQLWLKYKTNILDYIDNFVVQIWSYCKNIIFNSGSKSILLYQSFILIFTKPYRFKEVIKHIEFIGNKSLIIIALTSVFTGMAFAYQIYLGFSLVNATSLVGPTLALGITRELGPVLTGLIVAARAGGAMAARLGTMQVTEQIDALKVMGVNPKQYLVAPRVIAAVISMPILCGFFDCIAIAGAHFLCVEILSLDKGIFWYKIQLWVDPRDVIEGLIKSSVFGMVFSSICTSQGLETSGGAKGVGESTNRGVVNSMVLIIIINFFMTNLLRMF